MIIICWSIMPRSDSWLFQLRQ